MTRRISAPLALALATAVSAALAHGLAQSTATRIGANRAEAENAALAMAIPASVPRHLLEDATSRRLANGAELLTVADGEVTLVKGWRAEGGYSGPLELLLSFDRHHCLIHVDVLRHRETPGLGDRVERRHSDWLRQFDGRCHDDTTARDWRTRVDGGTVDAMTGATVTSRAVLDGIRRALESGRQP